MAEELGNRLIREKLVSEEQVEKALARQKLHGGRLGVNLIALGFIEQQTLVAFFKKTPPPPKSIRDTGLELDLIVDLVLKTISFMSTFTLQEVAERIRLPVSIIDRALEVLRREKLCEVKGGTDYARTSYRFSITTFGRDRAQKPMAQSDYIGPAPVNLHDYQTMVESQSIKTAFVNQEDIKKAFSPLVVNPRILSQLGPAVNSGKSIFLYGPSGNGKTIISETIANLFNDYIYIPYAIEADRQIIRIFDPSAHHKATEESSALPLSGSEETDLSENAYDHRWVLCKRPVIMIGGEMTLQMLDLEFDEISKFYEAPFQMKANGGTFIIDDFGRQILSPRELLNRWIVPLERRTDYLTLHTGKKFEVPFDELIIFSTNIDPKELVDEAFLRRIRYKIEIGHPSEAEYEAIFKTICAQNGIEFKSHVLDFLFKECYQKTGAPLNACHPRDLIDQVIDITRYRETQPVLTQELIAEAWANYFVKL